MKLTENFERMALPLLHCFSLSIYLIKTVSKKRNSLCPFVQNRHKKILKYRLTFNNSNLLLRKSNTFNSLKNSACKKQKITKEKKKQPTFSSCIKNTYLSILIGWRRGGVSRRLPCPGPGLYGLRVLFCVF